MSKKKNYSELEEEIRKLGLKAWGTTYQKKWKELYEQGKELQKTKKKGQSNEYYERLWKAVKAEVQGYIDENNMTVKDAIGALRRSRYYTSQADFYRNSIYDELKAIGVNRGAKGRFVSFRKENIQYHGEVTIDDEKYQKYSFIVDGKTMYYYKNRSPKDEHYEPLITEVNYE